MRWRFYKIAVGTRALRRVALPGIRVIKIQRSDIQSTKNLMHEGLDVANLLNN